VSKLGTRVRKGTDFGPERKINSGKERGTGMELKTLFRNDLGTGMESKIFLKIVPEQKRNGNAKNRSIPNPAWDSQGSY